MREFKTKEDNTTQLRDINDQIQELIVESLKMSEIMYIRGDYMGSYRAIKNVFWKISPFDFNRKQTLMLYTAEIDKYLEAVEGKKGGASMADVIQIGKKQYQLKVLIEDYLKLIPECLLELQLYLRIIKRNDDRDEVFSDETFTTNESLLEHKRKELRTLTVNDFLKCLTPTQTHAVHSRVLTYPDYKGMKRLPVVEEEDES